MKDTFAESHYWRLSFLCGFNQKRQLLLIATLVWAAFQMGCTSQILHQQDGLQVRVGPPIVSPLPAKLNISQQTIASSLRRVKVQRARWISFLDDKEARSLFSDSQVRVLSKLMEEQLKQPSPTGLRFNFLDSKAKMNYQGSLSLEEGQLIYQFSKFATNPRLPDTRELEDLRSIRHAKPIQGPGQVVIESNAAVVIKDAISSDKVAVAKILAAKQYLIRRSLKKGWLIREQAQQLIQQAAKHSHITQQDWELYLEKRRILYEAWNSGLLDTKQYETRLESLNASLLR